jgi:hypothetical protein
MRPCLLVLVSLSLGGCVFLTEPIEQLELTLTLSSPVMLGDSGITVVVEARNNSPLPIVAEQPCGLRAIGIRVIPPGEGNAPGGYGFPRDGGCRGISPPERVVVDARGFIRAEFPISPTVRVASGRAVRWPEGEYRVIAFLRDSEGEPVNETDPVTFTLVCSEPNATEC